MNDMSMDDFFADWNIDIHSDKYRELNNRYFDTFEYWLPLQIMPKTITIEELEKEVDEAINTGVDLTVKYDNDDTDPVDESNLQRIE